MICRENKFLIGCLIIRLWIYSKAWVIEENLKYSSIIEVGYFLICRETHIVLRRSVRRNLKLISICLAWGAYAYNRLLGNWLESPQMGHFGRVLKALTCKANRVPQREFKFLRRRIFLTIIIMNNSRTWFLLTPSRLDVNSVFI